MDSQPIKVLLVDDDLGDFEMTRALLSQAEHGQYSLEWASTFEEAMDAFRGGGYDVYLLDYFLEDRTGLDLLQQARAEGIDGPFIMLTGRGSRNVDLEAMGKGASDYLVKGKIDPELLERSIRYALERQRDSRRLMESEERHRSMFENLPVGLYRSGPDGTYLDANPALVRILGYPDKGMLQRRYAEEFYVHPDDRSRFETLLERNGVVRGFESVIQRVDGGIVKVRNSARIHRGPNEDVLYVEGTLEDVTEEKAAETLRGCDARFRVVFDGSGTGIALADLRGLILDANPAFADAFHSTAREMEGASYLELLSPDDRPGVERELEILSKGESARMEAERRFRAQTGPEFWARASLNLIRDSEGEPNHLVILLDDLSQ